MATPTLEQLSLSDLYVSENGVVMPNTSDVKALVEEVFTDALGTSCDFTAETPLGRLVEAITFLVSGTVRINALCAGQIDPYHATGTFLDAVSAFHNVYRKSRIRTVVTATLLGTQGTTVPAGSLASTDNGDVFFLNEDAEIGDSGTVDATFSSSEYGPIPCDAGTLTRINTAFVGWTGITNGADGILGAATESDASLRKRVVAANDAGIGFVNSIRSAVLAVDGVTSCIVYENGDSATTVINGVVLEPHSVYICVENGESTAIAEAIYRTKPAGCGMTSSTQQGSAQQAVEEVSTTTNKAVTVDSTEVTFADNATGASYAIRFYRPSTYQPKVLVTVYRLTYPGSDLAGDVQSAVANYVNSLDIGSSLTSFGIGMAVQSALPTVGVAEIKIQSGEGAEPVSEIAVYGYQVPRIDEDDVVVTIAR